MKGLVVKSPAIDAILDGTKTIDVRGSNTSIRGPILLLKSGTKTILGSVEIVDSVPMSLDEYNNWNYRILMGKEKVEKLPYKKTYKWILNNPKKFDLPIPYVHPAGAIVWVNIEDFKI